MSEEKISELSESELFFVDIISLLSIRIEAIESILFEKGVLDKESFKKLLLSKIENGQDEEMKKRFKYMVEEKYK